MDTLPNRDTVAAFEARLGPRLMTALIWLLAGGLAVGALTVIITGVRAAWTFFYPLMPSGSWWVDMATNLGGAVVAALLVVLINYIAKILRSVQASLAQSHKLAAQLTSAENEQLQKLVERFDKLEGRFDYVEKKVGSELHDQLVEELMKRSDDRYYVRTPETAPPPPTPRLELGKKILREAAAEARRVVKGEKLDFSSEAAAGRAWLHMTLIRFAREILSPDALNDFEIAEKARKDKMEQRNQSPNGKDHFIKIAEHFENLAENLDLDDLDPDAEPLPASFEQFRRSQN